MSQTEAKLQVSFNPTFQLVMIYHRIFSKIFEQETEQLMSASNGLPPAANTVQNAQCQVGNQKEESRLEKRAKKFV